MSCQLDVSTGRTVSFLRIEYSRLAHWRNTTINRAYQITDSKAVAVVASPKRLETAKAACRVSGLSVHNKLYVLADRDVDGIRCIKPSLEDLSKNQHLEQVSADDICLLCYSSGTSGLPKVCIANLKRSEGPHSMYPVRVFNCKQAKISRCHKWWTVILQVPRGLD